MERGKTMKKIYRYEGVVTSFGKVISDIWKGGTQAETEGRARANLMFSYKIKHKLDKSTKIELPGKIFVIE